MNTDGRRMLGCAAAAAALLGMLLTGCGREGPDGAGPAAGGIDPSLALGGEDVAGFERASRPRRFEFPADHGPHPGFRNEWWYFTGNLRSTGGRAYGYQLTLFRIGLRPGAPDSESAWRTNQLYMAHLAISDIDGGRFRAAEHFERAALGLAGASTEPLRIWAGPVGLRYLGREDLWRLEARLDGLALDLELRADKPRVLQGEAGLSQKGARPGNASYYYSITRMHTEGRLDAGEGPQAVQGQSWFDREWSTSALEPGQVGWDWFALQLDDGHELMYYQLRREDGQPAAQSAGVWVAPDGATRRLDAEAVQLAVLRHWRSPHTGVRYPAGWRLRLPGSGSTVSVEPAMADQELLLSVRYWEGAVWVYDEAGERIGRGYVELVGYR